MTAREQPEMQGLLPEPIDQHEVDWDRVARIRYLVRQRFRYEYPRPVRDLRHRLMVVPPDRLGDQHTVLRLVTASGTAVETQWSTDASGNVCVDITAASVELFIEFEARLVVERTVPVRPCPVDASALSGPLLLSPTLLTEPVPPLADAAASLRGGTGLALAEAACAWTHGALRYESGMTDVGTSAGRALELGGGVCQDYAHVMLALCRLLGLPARYVSGHVMGEGGMHAWVEVVLPDPASSSAAAAVPFDPTYGRPAGLDYVTVATGRDYRDVAPTSGTYTGSPGGRLTASKRMDVVDVEYGRGRRTA